MLASFGGIYVDVVEMHQYLVFEAGHDIGRNDNKAAITSLGSPIANFTEIIS